MSSWPWPPEIRKDDPVTFMQFAGPRGLGDVDKEFALVVSQECVWKQSRVRRRTHTQIDVKVSIVIGISKVGAHRHEHLFQTNLGGYILKRSVVLVAIELDRLRIERLASRMS